MLRSIIISPNRELAEELQQAVSVPAELTVTRIVDHYPAGLDLGRILRAQGPEVVFLNFEALEPALEVVRVIEIETPGVQVCAFHSVSDAKALRDTMRAGIREHLAPPFERTNVIEALRNMKERLEIDPVRTNLTNQIFSFLPSKAGVGASTLALNISAALASRPDTRVLLSDFDLNSGMLRFMLKLSNEYCVLDALEHAGHVDEDVWPQLVTSKDRLDVLHAGRINPSVRIEAGQIRNLMGFLRRSYDAMCFDLSGNLERYSLEIMQESKRILLVCTPEIASLHLAREKITYLRHLELDSRVSVVLNRCQKKPLFTKEQVEDVLALPVLRTFGNDYHSITRAVTQGRWLEPSSELGRQFGEFATELVDRKAPKVSNAPKRRFLEYFNVGETAIVPTK